MGDLKVLQKFVDEDPQIINMCATLKKGRSGFHKAVQNDKRPEVLSILLTSKADVNCPDAIGDTPLHLAAREVRSMSIAAAHARTHAHPFEVGARDDTG